MKFRCIFVLFCSVLLASCADEFDKNKEESGFSGCDGVPIGISKSIDSEKKALICGDYEKVKANQVDQSQIQPNIQKYYKAAFGDPSVSNGVPQFINERIKKIYAENSVLKFSSKSSVTVLAANIGASIWFGLLEEGKKSETYLIEDESVHISSPRVGLVQLGAGYRKRENEAAGVLLRSATLVHEARHSDCTGGISQEQWNQVKNSSIEGIMCSHLHSICPKGHDYEGTPACEDHLWGAYAIDALYAQALSQSCVNCSVAEKVILDVLAIDSFTRLTKENKAAIQSGEAPLPDLSSTGVHD